MTTSGTFVVESTTSEKFTVGDSYAITFAEGPIFVSTVSLLEAATPETIPVIPADDAPTTFEAPITETDTTPPTVSEAQPPVGFVPTSTSSPTESDSSDDSTAPSDTPAS